MLLAIDTATRMAGLALYDPDHGWVLGEEAWYSANNHTVELLPRLARLLDQQEIAPRQLTRLVVSQGPGSFTRLRVSTDIASDSAASVARGLPILVRLKEKSVNNTWGPGDRLATDETDRWWATLYSFSSLPLSPRLR